MIDIHSHILFGLDDGASSPQEMIEMAKQAVSNGITTIVATPHHKNGVYHNPREAIEKRLMEAQAYLEQHNIPLTLLPGMEIRVYDQVTADLQAADLITYNDKNRHILLEMPHDHVPLYVERTIFELKLAGYVPIIPHPERNRQIQSDPNVLYRLIRLGALAQLTASSIVGRLGKEVQKSCFDMIGHQLVQLIASDAHDTGNRGFLLKEAYEAIRHHFGEDYLHLFLESAEAIATGQECPVLAPEKISRRFFGRLWSTNRQRFT